MPDHSNSDPAPSTGPAGFIKLMRDGDAPSKLPPHRPTKPSSEGRFVWQSSLALERITNQLGQTQAAYGVAVYVALCRLSGKQKNNPQFAATVNKIAGMARLSYRKTFDVLSDLEDRAKVISIVPGARIKGQAKQPENTFILLSLRLHNTQPTDCTRARHSHAENPKDSLRRREKKRPLRSQGYRPCLTAGEALLRRRRRTMSGHLKCGRKLPRSSKPVKRI